MNLAMIVLFNCTFTFVVYLIMARKVSKAREEQYYFEKYYKKLRAFTTLVEKFINEVAKKEGLTIVSMDVKPKFDGVGYVLLVNAAILDRQNSTNRSLLFTIYESYPLIDREINSYEFLEKRTSGWKHQRRISRKYLFEDWLKMQYSSEEVELLKEVNFKTLVIEVSDEFYPIGKKAVEKINEEFKEAEKILDKTMVSKTISSIKRKSSNLIKLASDVDDIDISVSISEFDENTNAFVEFVTNEMEKDLKKASEKSNEYLSSIDSIRKSLKSFISLKEKGLLTDDKEVSIQDEVDKEISKWNKFIKEEA